MIQSRKGPLVVASASETRIDDIATVMHHGAPDDLARLGFAIARGLGADGPATEDLPEDLRALATTIVQSLQAGDSRWS